MSDNFHFDLSCTPLEESLKIAFHGSPSRTATHFFEDRNADKQPTRLLLAWHEKAGVDFREFFAGPIDATEAVELVKKWLKTAHYGPEPDHDGDNGRSWHIYNGSWGRVGDNHYVFAAVEPEWAMYGK